MPAIHINVDGREIEAEEGNSVLAACLAAGIYVPHLCAHANLSPSGECGLCVVDIGGLDGSPISCKTQVDDGMVVQTKSERLDHLRRAAMLPMLAGHPPDCGTCVKYLNCEFQSLKQYFAIDQAEVPRRPRLFAVDASNPLFLRNPNKCVVCGRCLAACHDLRGVGVLGYASKDDEKYVTTISGLPLAEAGCKFCGACAEVCPTGAIMDKQELTEGKTRKAALVPCRYACPAEIDVPRYVRFIREKNYSAATAVIREKVPFPLVLGYVCDHPCESVCRRGEVNEPIAIRNLKRFAAEQDTERLWEKSSKNKAPTDKRVAVIGSGPAGLTAAYYLVNQGHAVTVFEALPLAGGMLRYGIPEYRLPREVLDGEIRAIVNRGVEIKSSTHVESIDALFEEGYNAVLIAMGTHKGQKLRLSGAQNKAVLVGLDFLRDVNMGNQVEVGGKVVVLGGGNVAFDCARVARRLGAKQVDIACLEPRDQMLAAADEIEQGIEEGIRIHGSKTFTRIVEHDGNLAGVECLDVTSFSFDEDKRLQVEVVENSEHILEADTIIFAIGQRADIPKGFGLNGASSIPTEADQCTVTTSSEGVFAAGDAVAGTGSVIKAIASGRKSAIAIDKFLGGHGRIEERLAPPQTLNPYIGPGERFAAMSRCEEFRQAAEKRIESFCKVVEEMDEGTANYESERCLQCDLRLNITPVKFWGNY